MLISIVVPFYEGKSWLIDALKSVYEQTYKDIEVIVIDDGSNEDISDISYFSDPRFVWKRKNNGGAASARNLGMQMSNGKYIAFLDSDDIWHKNKIEIQSKYMEESGCEWSHHSYYKFWDSGKKSLVDTSSHKGKVNKQIFTSFRVQTSTVMVSRKIIEENGILFPVDYKRGQDGQFYRKLSLITELGYVEDLVGYFRMRGENVGFNPRVLLHNKYQIWRDIKVEPEQVKAIPHLTKAAYSVSYHLWRLVYGENLQVSKERSSGYMLDGFLYLLPYVMLKLSSKINK
ncbi:TPA: glycosyltransferase family 2 protein [Vibrio vulnificus]|uniref:Glycosyltransferase family 2 protein n=1 Tax=Vibrio vulnificus TaxID=672 RepID=A0A8H9THP8_VIBVL|nr:glycosyltransferase family A protein [Vibrio vulnificus]EMB7843717.1 glycosyltransferase family 2 protein [Vibrio vulnificus]HAS8542707.1 glycosyltransferase family 2 protein [Vibrio vulnificus]